MRRVPAALLAACLAAFAACRHSVPPASAPAPAPIGGEWTRKTLARLTLEEKVGQMIGVRMFGLHANPRSKDARHLLDSVKRLKVGSVVAFESEVGSLPRRIADLQAVAAIPLLVAADLERGVNFRIRRGVVPLPSAMAIGATRSEEDARFVGEVTAREARALGINWAFAPVADVNNNPGNPVINMRSFAEDPELVARMVAAVVSGARQGGLLTTAKHFPGHGDTAVDSHLQLASIPGDRARLDKVELLPFRRAIEAEVDSIMVGHIAAPALDPTGTPATLSEPMGVDLLRRDLGFRGLIVTDALEMHGVKAAWTGEAAVRAIRAGADFILLPPDPEVALKAVVREVRAGRLPESRIDDSVRLILAAKERLGLHKAPKRGTPADLSEVGRPEDVERALAVARRSITVVRNEGNVLPIAAETPVRILHLVLSSDLRNDQIAGIPEDELTARRVPTRTVSLGPEVSEARAAELVAQVPEYTHVLATAFVRVAGYKGTADMSEAHGRLLAALAAAGRPVILVSFGSPYLLRQAPDVAAYVCAYGGAESSQRAAIGALFGEYPVTGRLPVTIPGHAPYGGGLQIPMRRMTLRTAAPESVGFRSGGLAEVDKVIEDAVAAKAFPGGVVAVGKDGALVHLKAFGRQSYDEGAPAVKTDTLYDLASLTKVIVTTTAAMILVDEGKLDISKPVSAFLPEFRGGAKDKVTVWHLLTHSAGIDWWAPLFKELQGKDAYVKRIVGMDLVYEPGTKSLYSDLGLILLGEVVERVSGQSLDAFARERIFGPLGMKDATYKPGTGLVPRIAPTENDPWRGRVLKGEVHDENAHALGGVAPHAGLFGSAPDVARFAQMLVNGGVFENKRIVSREVLERFVKRAGVPESSRALGWDTPSDKSSAGDLLSRQSFGHTGFTGTSLWIDPERKMFIILLTNRVHPTRDNNAIRQVRRDVADSAARALVQP